MLKKSTQDEWILESPVAEGERFTDSDPWRVFRIMGEFVEGFDTLAGLGAAISIFGSARTGPDDPNYQATIETARLPIFERAVANETDSQVQRWMERFAAPTLSKRDRQEALREAYTPFREHGRCDFCGEKGRRVRTDYETELKGSGGSTRLAQICQQCDGRQ